MANPPPPVKSSMLVPASVARGANWANGTVIQEPYRNRPQKCGQHADVLQNPCEQAQYGASRSNTESRGGLSDNILFSGKIGNVFPVAVRGTDVLRLPSTDAQGDTLTDFRDDDQIDRLDLTPDPRMLEMLGQIPYRPWQCLAELIDNSFDELLSGPGPALGKPEAVYITVPKPATSDEDAQVTVSDFGRGMDRGTLEKSLRAGYTGKSRFGTLGLFGMGFNIATARLGNRTEVHTTQSGDEFWLVAEIDLRGMQRRGSFHVPVRRVPKDDPTEHGTKVVVSDLEQEMLDTLRRPNTMTSVRQRLGRIYSFMLRSGAPVPGVPDWALAGRGVALYLNGKRVEPWLPCVWSGSRSVSYRGAEVKAVQIIHHRLTDAYVCTSCGYSQRHENSGVCMECEAQSLELRSRRVHGWLGIQRYLHATEYGIDFIRNGRAILVDERELFSWQDPETGNKYVEYPVEIPYDGRLVGEIHLDHVAVDYQKTDFKRDTPEWRDAVIHLRGEGPMRELKAKERGYAENRSPLGTLFKAFQRNDPGLRCLTPGNGSTATHELAREWGGLFRKGLPDYQTDERWYEAAARHDESKGGGGRGRARDIKPGDVGARTGLDLLPPSPPPSEPTAAPGPTGGTLPGSPESIPSETEDERFERYRKDAREFFDLAGDVAVAGIGKRHVRVFETTTELVSPSGKPTPVVSRAGVGMNLDVYVNGEHQVFREYGRDPRDYAIIEIAQALRVIAHSDTPLLAVAAEVTREFPDQRTTPSTLRDRAEVVAGRIRELMSPIVTRRPSEMWTMLPFDRKITAEREAARNNPTLDWREATRDGRFAGYIDCAAIASMVDQEPGEFLDGMVFTAKWAGWSDEQARDRQVSQVVRLLETVGEFLADPWTRSRPELSMARLSIDMLDQIVARAE
jgi:hypothetical protein